MAAFQLAGQCLDRGDLRNAVIHYQAAIDHDPDFMEAHYNLGLAYQGLAMNELAAKCYSRALALKPGYFSALNNLGQVLAGSGRLSAAEDVYRQALSESPQRPEPYFNLGVLSMKRRDLPNAIDCYRQAIRINPEMLEAYNNLGNAFQEQQKFTAAAKCYRQVVKIDPQLAEGYYNLGSVLRRMDRFDEAIENLSHALTLKPSYKQALNNLALCYKATGQLGRAMAYFTKAIRIDSNFAEARWNRSFTFLLSGEFREGWEDFEWRFKQPKWKSLYPFRLSGPRWDGSVRHHLRLLVHDEQGLGDTLQFVRYLPRVKERVRSVVLETRRTLIPLLAGFPGIDQIIERSTDGIPKTDYDAQVALMSLPYLFRTRLSNIPDGVPYLEAPRERVLAWKKRISDPGLKVGIVWAGRPEHMNDHNRSCRLEQFAVLADLKGLRWYSLQKGPAEAQLGDWQPAIKIKNLGAAFKDFADTAAAIANLDLVITVDTSVAHLAGAMGAPVWVFLPYIPDWRWMMRRQDSPWYPTMRLFRQPEQGDWHSVFSQTRRDLQQMLQHRLMEPQCFRNRGSAHPAPDMG